MDAGTKAINYASIIIGGALGVAVGYIIYQRTIARAKELEIEELEAARGEGGEGVEGYFDGVRADGAAGMDEDDISLWDNEDIPEPSAYTDDFTDEDDVFARGDVTQDYECNFLGIMVFREPRLNRRCSGTWAIYVVFCDFELPYGIAILRWVSLQLSPFPQMGK